MIRFTPSGRNWGDPLPLIAETNLLATIGVKTETIGRGLGGKMVIHRRPHTRDAVSSS